MVRPIYRDFQQEFIADAPRGVSTSLVPKATGETLHFKSRDTEIILIPIPDMRYEAPAQNRTISCMGG